MIDAPAHAEPGSADAEPVDARPLSLALIGLSAALIAVGYMAATAWPLATYSVTLACFGLVHVISELRYVDARFGLRFARRHLALFATLIGAIVLLRALALSGLWQPPVQLELILVAALAVSVLAVPGLRAPWRLAVLALVGLLALGIALAPLATVVALALLHNFTPLGFVAERLRGQRRTRALLVGAALFLLLPTTIALGLPQQLLTPTPSDPFGLHLTDQLRVFVFPSLQTASVATQLFAVAAFTQVLHYVYVILVLPSFDTPTTWRGLVPWPAPLPTTVALLGLIPLTLALFLLSFTDARATYGLFAAAHAWIEIPALLAASSLNEEPGRG